jgi:hypothetical protein
VLHNPSPRRPSAGIPILLGILLALWIAVPALADYLGPNRAETVWDWNRLRCRYQAVYDPPGSGWYGCTLELYEPPDGSCPGDVADYFSSAYCGWPQPFCQTPGCSISLSAAVVSCSEGEEGCRAVERTVTQPEATVSGSVSCAVSGNGGWCRGGAELSLSGSEPLSGYAILALEGTRNGETFACPGAACGVPLLEGGNEFTFWAVSSWGDTSQMGTASGSVDSRAPVLSGELSGTTGDNGWFVSEVTLTAGAADAAPGSGLSVFELSLDGGGWSAYGGPLTLGEGEHTVDLRAQDVAGNVSTENQAVNVDTQPPDVDLSANPSFCPGCGEQLEIAVDVQDGGSGVVEWTLGSAAGLVTSGSGATSQVLTWDGGGLPGGSHTLTLGARDAAGNAAESSLAVSLVVPTAVPHSTEVPTEEPPPSSTSVSPTAVQSPTPSVGPTATPTVEVVPFGGIPAAPVGGGGGDTIVNPPSEILGGPQPLAPTSSTGVLWGAAALAVTSGATAVALDQARRRRDEEARVAAEMRRKNAEAEAREGEQRRSLAATLAAAAASAVAQARTTAGNTVSGATTALTEQWYEWRMDGLEERWEREQAEARERAREAARQQALRATAAATASGMVAGLEGEARQRAAAIARSERLRQIAEGREEGAGPSSPRSREEATDTLDALGFIDENRDIASMAVRGARVSQLLGAAGDVRVGEVGSTLRVYGPRASRNTLGLREMVNWVRAENRGMIAQDIADRAVGSLRSWGLVFGMGLSLASDTLDYVSGESDRQEYAAALTIDTGFSIGTALLAGAAAGAATGALVGVLAANVTLPIVGTVPGAVLGGIAGAALGIVTSLVLSGAFEGTGTRRLLIDGVANLYRSWTGAQP